MITTPFLIAAFVAGLLMFLAPCTLPIVPGYLAFISGVPMAQLSDPLARHRVRGRIVKNAFFFVLGFSVIFIVFGIFASALGSLLGEYRYVIARAGGALIVFFGLTLIGLFKIPSFLAEKRIKLPSFLTLGHPSSSFLVGALFALGWSPCVGPILGSILLLAGSQGGALTGGVLLSVFSLGLGAPFILVAFLIGEANALMSHMQGFMRVLSYVGGIFLVFLGILMLLGDMGVLISYGYSLFDFLNYDALLKYL